MSQTDTADPVDARDDRPIVLIINSLRAQTYLDDNEVLNVLYGTNVPRRIAVELNERLWCPDLEDATTRLALLDAFANIPARDLAGYVRSLEYYFELYGQVLESAGLERHEIVKVRVVIAEQGLFTEHYPLRAVIRQFFTSPALFSVDVFSMIPKRV